MKKLLLSLTVFLFPVILFTACEEPKDKTPDPVPPIEEDINVTYTNRPFPERVLELDYCGHPLGDKDVSFKTRDFKTATVILENVIPGEDNVAFSVNVARRAGEKDEVYDLTVDNAEFTMPAGTKVTPGRMTVRRNRFELELADVVFLPNTLSRNQIQTGWWGLVSPAAELYWKIKVGTYTLPSGVEVEITEANSVNPGAIGELADILGSLLIPGVIRDIHFDRQGRISAHYSDFAIEGTPNWQMSPQSNLCHYYVRDGKLMVKPNIAQILGQASTRADGGLDLGGILGGLNLNEILESIGQEALNELLATLSSWMKNGIPLHIVENADGSVAIFITEEEVGNILNIAAVILPSFQDQIAEMLPPDIADLMGDIIREMLSTISMFAPATEEFRFGINLGPITEPAELAGRGASAR